jgi:hypothetical protein
MEKANVSDNVEATVIRKPGPAGPVNAEGSVQSVQGIGLAQSAPYLSRRAPGAAHAHVPAPVVRDTIRPDTPYTPYQLTPMQHLAAAQSSARRLGILTANANETTLDDEDFLQELRLEWGELASHVGVLSKRGSLASSGANSALRTPRTPPVPASVYARNVR